MPAMRIWFTILVSWPAPAVPIKALAFAYAPITGLASS